MPTDAAQLIADLDAHPKACGMLGLRFGLGCAGTPMVSNSCISLLENDTEPWNSEFSRWLTGACVEKCDELGIVLDQEETEFRMWYWFNRNTLRSDPHAYDTRLGAALAALERHDG